VFANVEHEPVATAFAHARVKVRDKWTYYSVNSIAVIFIFHTVLARDVVHSALTDARVYGVSRNAVAADDTAARDTTCRSC